MDRNSNQSAVAPRVDSQQAVEELDDFMMSLTDERLLTTACRDQKGMV
jgi:hypothetical protein